MKQYMPRKLPRDNGYAELINLRALGKTDLAPYSCSYAMRRALYIHLHPNQERGELKNTAPDGSFRFLLPRMDWDYTWITGLRQFSVQVCMCVIFDMRLLVTTLAQGPYCGI